MKTSPQRPSLTSSSSFERLKWTASSSRTNSGTLALGSAAYVPSALADTACDTAYSRAPSARSSSGSVSVTTRGTSQRSSSSNVSVAGDTSGTSKNARPSWYSPRECAAATNATARSTVTRANGRAPSETE